MTAVMTQPESGVAAPGGPDVATICQVLHTLQVGGAEVLAARLARQLRDRYRFVFACLDALGTLGAQLRDEGFPVHVLNRRPGLDWRCSWSLARLLRRERVAIVQAHQYTPFFYALTARLLCRRPAILFTEHGRHYPDYPRRKRMFVNRLLLERRDRVVAVGQAVRQALIANEGLPADRVAVIYNGIDQGGGYGPPTEREAVRREIGVGSSDFVLIQVARLDYLKDHATAVRTLERVVRSRPDARLVLVGDGPEKEKILQLVRERGLGEQVRFLGQRGDVRRLLRAADVFLLTSISEGIPLTVIEALAAELPVVATRVGGVAEIVEEGQTGLLASAGDDAGLAEHVLRLAATPEVRAAMGQRGQMIAAAQFSEGQMHARYGQLYGKMLRG
jgi:glycosyltransferase involved in cell wall biosynthesis